MFGRLELQGSPQKLFLSHSQNCQEFLPGEIEPAYDKYKDGEGRSFEWLHLEQSVEIFTLIWVQQKDLHFEMCGGKGYNNDNPSKGFQLWDGDLKVLD